MKIVVLLLILDCDQKFLVIILITSEANRYYCNKNIAIAGKNKQIINQKDTNILIFVVDTSTVIDIIRMLSAYQIIKRNVILIN